MSRSARCPILLLIVCAGLFFPACHKNDNLLSTNTAIPFTVAANQLLYNNAPVQLIGANTFHVFSPGGSDMNSWHMDIDREFIGNMKETPLSGVAIKDTGNSWLYALQTIADSNRSNKRITIFCAFGWDGTNSSLFTGAMPAQCFWWNDYKTKLQQWARQFKDQPDVWLETWNEPYRYDRTDGYTDDTWMNDMNELVNSIRITGNNNIILVPCAEQGQDESVLLNKGVLFLAGKNNILFDIHAYEKWLLDSNGNIGRRLAQLQQKKLPVIFAETAPLNAGVLMNPQSFLDSVYTRGISVCAWTWKYDGADTDALLDANAIPNNTNNNNWGTLFKNLAARIRRP